MPFKGNIFIKKEKVIKQEQKTFHDCYSDVTGNIIIGYKCSTCGKKLEYFKVTKKLLKGDLQ